MIIDLPPRQPVIEWHQIVETCLKKENLTSNIYDSGNRITILPSTSTPDPTSQVETLDNVESSLQAYFATAVNQLADEEGITDPKSAFAQDAQSSLAGLIQEVENDKSSFSEPTSQMIQEVYRDALKSLFVLKVKYAQPTPSISSDPTSTNNISNTSDITPLPQTLILSGGGMKGVGYVGAYRAMEESGILAQINLIAGSSIGATTAAFIAAGMSPEMLQEVSDATNYKQLLVGTSSSPLNNLISFSSDGLFDSTNAMNQVNQGIAQSITLFFQNISSDDLQNQIDFLKENAALTDKQETLILQLRSKLLDPVATTPSNNDDSTSQHTSQTTKPPLVTFQDLDALHQLNPSQFKSLTVTGFNETQGIEVYFNVQNNPSMVIAQAVRISMALPGVFTPIKNDQGDTLEDGGIGSNTPSEVSDDPSTTLVCYFKQHGESGSFATWFEKELSGNNNLSQDEQQDLQKIDAAGSNAFAIYYGILRTTSFTASQQDIHAAELQAEVRVWEQLLARQN